MKKVAVFYATREGHTRQIAEHLAATLRARDILVEVQNVKDTAAPVDLGAFDGVIVAASIHMGRHEREMVRFVRTHRDTLDWMPTAFLSVSMAEAGVEDETAPMGKRMEAVHEVVGAIDRFFEETGWKARWVRPVAGALLYTQYGFLTRFVIKMIAKQAGASTDTAHDHVYTDWHALDRFAEEMALAIKAHPKAAAPRAA
jgi:menaquinone-dependent protoporphyrinogen oxidase